VQANHESRSVVEGLTRRLTKSSLDSCTWSYRTWRLLQRWINLLALYLMVSLKASGGAFCLRPFRSLS
jgi:hypothetical protein